MKYLIERREQKETFPMGIEYLCVCVCVRGLKRDCRGDGEVEAYCGKVPLKTDSAENNRRAKRKAFLSDNWTGNCLENDLLYSLCLWGANWDHGKQENKNGKENWIRELIYMTKSKIYEF